MTSAIRKAAPCDIPTMLDLLVQVDMVHHRARPDLFKGPATKYTQAQLMELLKDEQKPIFVYTNEDDDVLGYAFCQIKDQRGDNVLTDMKSIYIDDLCVDERARGQGVGRALYEHVLDFARAIGCYNVTLNVWAGNDSAKQFYEAMGMKIQKYGMETIL